MTPRRWTVNTRVWAYRYLVLRDGEQCSLCHANMTAQNVTAQNKLDIDHIDGNPHNNHPANLRLLCRSCNVKAGHQHRRRSQQRSALREREKRDGRPSTRIARKDANYREGSPEMQANLLYEVPFRRWLMRKVRTEGGYDRTTAIAEGAEVVGCSPLTTARYITKLTSPSGPLLEIDDALCHRILVLKPHLQTPATFTNEQTRRASPRRLSALHYNASSRPATIAPT